MEVLVAEQRTIKSRLESDQSNFKKSPKDRLAKKAYMEVRLDILNNNWKDFVENHKKILQLNEEQTSDYFTNDLYSITQEVYIDYKTDMLEALNVVLAKASTSKPKTPDSGPKESFVQLPKISIPTFSGKYIEWTTFRDLYISLIHENQALEDVQKMHYLKGLLSGEAEQLLRHVPITAANYVESWQILNSRYNNKKFLANCLLQRFMNQPTIVNESCTALKSLLDTTVDTLNGLKNLEINVKSWDVIIIYILTSKLDSESRKQWESRISKSDDLPTMKQMNEFLEYRFRSLEFLDNTKTKSKSSNSSNIKAKAMHALSNNNTDERPACPFCKKKDHKISNCKQFAKVDYDTRSNFVQTNGLCFNCLGHNHSVNICRVTTKCHICKRKHHSLLHPKSNPESSSTGKPEPEKETIPEKPSPEGNSTQPPEKSVHAHFSKKNVFTQILLATALVEVSARHGQSQLLRALLDQGSQASFITESAVQLLGLKRVASKSTISGLGGDKTTLASKYVVTANIKSCHDPNFNVQVRTHVLSAITSLLPSEKVSHSFWPELEHVTLADPEFHTPNKIDILLGADVYGQLLREGLIKSPQGLSIAQNTALGWVVSGPTHPGDDDLPETTQCHHNIVNSMSNVEGNDLIKRFWEIESDTATGKILTQDEEFCEQFYAFTTERNSAGRYVVRLPFREEDPQCKYGNSRDIAVKRFHLLENRFKKNPEIKERYSEVIKEYLDLGHMEPVDKSNDPKAKSAVYLPHHAVIREDKSTTKVRVVFDASCKGTNGVSLNDTLRTGPALQQDLRHIIMRWRTHPICLSADIIKMYRQVLVANQDTDFQRLVWRDDPESEIKDYRLVRVTFGTASAPYLAVRSLQQVSRDEGKACPDVAERVMADFYVDDLMTGCQTVEEGRKIHKEMQELLLKGGFELQKWITNDKELAQEITKAPDGLKDKVDFKMDEVVKVLGLSWDRETDSFRYSVKLPPLQEPITKRKVVSDIARLFDPLGWAAPCVITAKVMIQKLWLAGLDWDESLTDDLLEQWLSYREKLIQVQQFHIPRWMETRETDTCTELHGFCDASNIAYAAAVYLRNKDKDGQVHTHLVAAKTKVAPVMQVSIPRLELMGATLLAKLLTEVGRVLSIEKIHIHGWTDSTIVLAWLSSHPSRWTTFVGNRTSDILSRVDSTHWAHVQSTHNPADIASRGISSSELSQNGLWMHGPSWLKDEQVEYTRPKAISTDMERRKIKTYLVANTELEDDILWTKYSSLTRLVRVVAYCRRFLKLKENKAKGIEFEPFLTSEEINEALKCCIKQCQARCFKDDKAKLKPLCPTADNDGILRAGGRIDNADLADATKHPIILPYKSHFTDLVVDDVHKRTLHGGAALMLNNLRSKYWIVSAKRLVKAHVRKCVVCTRHAAATRHQLMGQLPSCRVKPSRTFLNSGVDFAGPINIRMSKGRGNKSYKGYICLFVCMATKAIHLEVISDLTTNGFIAGFKRFVARRGHVSNIWSDNGTNFVGASRELQRLVASEQSSVAQEIRSWLSNNRVSWHFIPPHAPNFGGLWEAGVKSTKFHLNRVIGNSTLTYEELSTVLTQIEACLNSRPLSMLPDDNNQSLPLTPGHFIVGEPLITVSDHNYEQCNVGTLRRWQLTQRMVQEFWRRWSQEYLVYLMQRYKWTKIIPEPNVGDVVLVKEDNLPPSRWLMGKITEKHPGLDNVTRVVTLKCNSSLIKRPTSKLCVLPVTE